MKYKAVKYSRAESKRVSKVMNRFNNSQRLNRFDHKTKIEPTWILTGIHFYLIGGIFSYLFMCFCLIFPTAKDGKVTLNGNNHVLTRHYLWLSHNERLQLKGSNMLLKNIVIKHKKVFNYVTSICVGC